MVLFVLWQLRREVQGREVLWHVDNTVALSSLVKGMPKETHISRIVEAVHILMCRLDCRIWFEFVKSDDNWADGISRVGFRDELVVETRARLHPLQMSANWWSAAITEFWTMSIS